MPPKMSLLPWVDLESMYKESSDRQRRQLDARREADGNNSGDREPAAAARSSPTPPNLAAENGLWPWGNPFTGLSNQQERQEVLPPTSSSSVEGRSIYLDNMGAVPCTTTHLQRVHQYLAHLTHAGSDTMVSLGNPHSAHAFGLRSRQVVEDSRRLVLEFFGASEEYEVIFTASTTAALKLCAEAFPFRTNKEGALNFFACHLSSHNSVHGVREMAHREGASVLASFETAAELQQELSLSSASVGRVGLVAVPWECNFSGDRFPVLDWTREAKQISSDIAVLVDGAAAAGKTSISLDGTGIDFFACSFYKMFGYPTGLGALLVKRSTAPKFFTQKCYFGGGTVTMNAADGVGSHQLRTNDLASKYEDGTPNYLAIAALRPGFQLLAELGGVQAISGKLQRQRRLLVEALYELRHGNGAPVVKTHSRFAKDNETSNVVGSSVALSVLEFNGDFIGHALVEKLASLQQIHIRAGCFCNPGACQRFLGLTPDQMRQHHSMGHVCWDDRDLVDGKPTGCVRVSLGIYNTDADVEAFVDFIRTNFLRADIPAASASERVNRGVLQSVATIQEIKLYPIKGLVGISVPAWPLTRRGLLFDREWIIVRGSDFLPVGPKQNPLVGKLELVIDAAANTLCVIHPSDPKRHLRLVLDETVAPDAGSQQAGFRTQSRIAISPASKSNPSKKPSIQVRARTVETYAVYDTIVDDWFTSALLQATPTGSNNLPSSCDRIRLLRCCSSSSADGEGGNKSTSNFVNTGELLVVSTESHEKVLRAIANEDDRRQVSLDSYRANLILRTSTDSGFVSNVVSRAGSPFQEHDWETLTLRLPPQHQRESPAVVELKAEGPCHRCQQVGFRPTSGLTEPEPLRAIASLCRLGSQSAPVFGQMFGIVQTPPTDVSVKSMEGFASHREALIALSLGSVSSSADAVKQHIQPTGSTTMVPSADASKQRLAALLSQPDVLFGGIIALVMLLGSTTSDFPLLLSTGAELKRRLLLLRSRTTLGLLTTGVGLVGTIMLGAMIVARSWKQRGRHQPSSLHRGEDETGDIAAATVEAAAAGQSFPSAPPPPAAGAVSRHHGVVDSVVIRVGYPVGVRSVAW